MYFGLFLSKLIIDSYNQGFNNFELNIFGNCDYLGYYLCGTPENRLKLNISGDCGSNLGICSSFVDYDITGSIGNYFGAKSENITLKLIGNCGDCCGIISKNFALELYGDSGNHFGNESIDMAATVYGNTSDVEKSVFAEGSKHFTFRTPYKEILRSLIDREKLIKRSKNSTSPEYVLIDYDGRVIKKSR
jgi:hypothetical protein